MERSASILAALLIAGGMAGVSPAHAAEDVVIVYDASGSMWGQIDGVSKMEIARDVMADLVDEWDHDTPLGLVAYGHRRQGDCSDIETLIAPGPLDKASFIDTVNAIKPKGKTPISASLQHAADLLAYRDSQATLVLISDGLETCNADPCAVSEQLARQGVKLTAHVVGFDLESDAHESLSCIADNTGGIFVPANSAAELHTALDQVQSAMKQPSAAPEPEPEPKPAPPEVEITAPEQVTTGAAFDVAWSTPIDTRDMIGIVPAGADPGTRGNYLRVKHAAQGSLRAPAEPGLYEVRYLLDEDGKTLASAPIEIVAAEVDVTAPEQATTGAVFDVAWSPPINTRDMVGIVPAGADPGTRGNYLRVKHAAQGSLRAPAEPGLYEVRYLLDEGGRTLASAPIEIVEAEVGIAGPAVVRAETDVDITWSSIINARDMVGIVPAGADPGTRGSYLRVKQATQGRLKAPAGTGLYEIRYILDEGGRTLASAPLEVVAADAPLDDGAGLSAPETAAAGETITVTWSGESDSADQRISLARKDQPDFSWISVQPVGETKSMELTMPDEAGFFEIRFLDIAGRELLGRSVVEVK